MIRLWQMSMLLVAVILVGGGDAPKGKKWTFTYEKGKVYSFQLETSAEHVVQYMTASAGYNGRSKDELHYLFDLKGKFDIEIKGVSAKGAEGLLTFRELTLGVGHRVDEQLEADGSKPSKTTRGTAKSVTLDSPGVDKTPYKVFLTSEGGIALKDKVDLSKCVKNLDAASSIHPDLGKRANFVFSEKFWQRYLSCHFISLPSKMKIPSGDTGSTLTGAEAKPDPKLKQNIALELFLDPCNSMTCTYASGKLDMSFITLTDKDDGSCELIWLMKGDVQEAEFCRSKIVTDATKLLTVRAAEGHLWRAPYEVQLWNYSGDADDGINHDFIITSLITCENVADAPGKTEASK